MSHAWTHLITESPDRRRRALYKEWVATKDPDLHRELLDLTYRESKADHAEQSLKFLSKVLRKAHKETTSNTWKMLESTSWHYPMRGLTKVYHSTKYQYGSAHLELVLRYGIDGKVTYDIWDALTKHGLTDAVKDSIRRRAKEIGFLK